MKYPAEAYSIRNREIKSTGVRYYVTGRNTRCGAGQSVFDAAKEMHGENAIVVTSLNAHHHAPFLDDVQKYGDPVGEVTVRNGESFYIYLRNQ